MEGKGDGPGGQEEKNKHFHANTLADIWSYRFKTRFGGAKGHWKSVIHRECERERGSLRSWIKDISVVNVTCASWSVFQSCRLARSPLLSSERRCLLIEAAHGENRWRDQWRKADRCFDSSDHPKRQTVCLMSGLYVGWALMMISTQPICLLMSSLIFLSSPVRSNIRMMRKSSILCHR